MNDFNLPDHLKNRPAKRSIANSVELGLGVATPPRISLEGTSFTLIDSNGDEIPITTNYLDCIIIDALAMPSRIYWGREYIKGVKNAPACFSNNGIGASQYAAEPQSALCQTCPQNVWGSAVSKVSGKPIKACGTYKHLAVMAYEHGEKDDEGVYVGALATDFPFLLQVPVMSHDNLRGLSDKFKGQEFDVSDVVTRITFVPKKVGVLDFLPLAFLDPDAAAAVDKILATKATDQLVGRDDRVVAAAVQQQLPAHLRPAGLEEPIGGAAEPVERPKPVAPPRPAEPLQIASAGTAKAGRGRPRKTTAGAEESTGPFAAPQQAHADAAPQRKAPFASTPSHGIVTNAGQPPESVEKALDSLFNLKSGQ